MSPLLLIAVGVLYALIAGQYVWNGRPFMALVFAGYALAQAGFVFDVLKGK